MESSVVLGTADVQTTEASVDVLPEAALNDTAIASETSLEASMDVPDSFSVDAVAETSVVEASVDVLTMLDTGSVTDAVVADAADEGPDVRTATPLSDFRMVDVNPRSSTTGMTISPRQHLGAISAWYFASAT